MLKQKKPSCSGDLNDVTLGNPAIFFRLRYLFVERQQELLKIRGFPSPDHSEFGFTVGLKRKAPKDKEVPWGFVSTSSGDSLA
jgi:hypothetical protein